MSRLGVYLLPQLRTQYERRYEQFLCDKNCTRKPEMLDKRLTGIVSTRHYTIFECCGWVVPARGIRARPGPLRKSTLRIWLVGGEHTLENVGRNEWLVIQK